jgi:hypothetical protein
MADAKGPTLTLTGKARSLELEHAALTSAPRHAVIAITAVHNPEAVAFAVRVVLEHDAAGNAKRADIAFITPYPSDRPGTFEAALSPASGEALTRPGRIVVSLEPFEAPLPSDLRVELSPPRWR